MRVLGIDPGSVKTGYGVIETEGARMSYREAGVISAPAGWPRWDRIRAIGCELRVLMDEIALGPADAFSFEDGFCSGMMGALVLGEARGVYLFLARERGVPVFGYAPTTVKKTVVGHGGAEKAQVAMMVRMRLGMKTTPEADSGDALAIAICHAQNAPTPLVRQKG